jgi:hypothetical protein
LTWNWSRASAGTSWKMTAVTTLQFFIFNFAVVESCYIHASPPTNKQKKCCLVYPLKSSFNMMLQLSGT